MNSEQISGSFMEIITLPLNKEYQIKFTNDCISLAPDSYLTVSYNYGIVPRNRPIGGLRVAKTEDYDGISNESIVTNYSYSEIDGMSSAMIQNIPNNDYYKTSLKQWIIPASNEGTPYFYWKYFFQINSWPNQSLSFYNGSPVIYKRVKVDKTKNNKSLGYSIYEFTGFTNAVVYSNNYPFVQNQNLEWREGLLLKENIYNASDELVKAVENEYEFTDGNALDSSNINLVTGVLADDDQNTLQEIVYGVRAYKLNTGRTELRRTKTRIYDGNEYIESIVDYSYNQDNYLVNKIKTKNSNGENIETRYYYPNDYTQTGLPLNVARYNGDAEIISEENWLQKENTWYLTNAFVNTYNAFENVIRKNKIAVSELLAPLNESEVGFFNPDLPIRHGSIKNNSQILSYDIKGRFTEIKPAGRPVSSFVWSEISSNYPIAVVEDASLNDVAATSFEPNAAGKWTIFRGLRNSTSALTGNYSYDLTNGNVITEIKPSQTYIVSYWAKTGAIALINGENASLSIMERNGWQYFEKVVTGVRNIVVSGVGLIDELRLYPIDAHMITYTYEPLIGLTSKCDENNNITYYEYDGFGRLQIVKDAEGKIIKKINYAFDGHNGNN